MSTIDLYFNENPLKNWLGDCFKIYWPRCYRGLKSKILTPEKVEEKIVNLKIFLFFLIINTILYFSRAFFGLTPEPLETFIFFKSELYHLVYDSEFINDIIHGKFINIYPHFKETIETILQGYKVHITELKDKDPSFLTSQYQHLVLARSLYKWMSISFGMIIFRVILLASKLNKNIFKVFKFLHKILSLISLYFLSSWLSILLGAGIRLAIRFAISLIIAGI